MTETEFNLKYPELVGCYRLNGLFSLGWYLGYTNGDLQATLDGAFDANSLRAIANYMDQSIPHRTITPS